jgi:hypothetical protein
MLLQVASGIAGGLIGRQPVTGYDWRSYSSGCNIIFEKGKSMTNVKGNVDNNSYIDHGLSKLVEFYDEIRTHL